ncbi:MAG: DAK2 domain-containing protein [Ruminococcaceae bacterium]|nr:DAK2 domain-containing protein [Oscillospiraceae bacterium]
MLEKINGSRYVEMLNSGIKNLELHRSELNDLNVFPVPDGDTGTNMVMTLRYGYEAVKNKSGSLSELSGHFASSAVFGARGNSGVIVSQFFKGISEAFLGAEEADSRLFSEALEKGVAYAYASVARPVEGTMLTVAGDASRALSAALPLSDIDKAVEVYLSAARVSLENTPNLLPVLKKANVVDSGGSGIVCFFEGVQKYLQGEPIEAQKEDTVKEYIDLSLFNKDTVFDYGYCVEGLIQLRFEPSELDLDRLKKELSTKGGSVVASVEEDKLKLHVHTASLGKLFEFCQGYGEFLTVKIDNMTVQNMQKEKEKKESQKFLYSSDPEDAEFSVVAVATNSEMQQKLFEMGADVVIMSDIAPSSQDFMDAFKLTKAKKILVFPNSSNSILTSMQAGSLYKNAGVTVLNCRSLAECYATLSVMDFGRDIEEAVSLANDTISNIRQVSIHRAVKESTFGSRHIAKNDFFSLSEKKVLEVGDTLENVTVSTVKSVLRGRECGVITIFYGKDIADEYIASISDKIGDLDELIEIAAVSTAETAYDITLIFE